MPREIDPKRMFDDERAAIVLDRMRTGETVKSIARSDGMPSYNTILDWCNGLLGAPSTWASDYARARSDQADGFVADIIELADGVGAQAQANAQAALDDLPDNATEAEKRRAEFFARKRSGDDVKLQVDVRKWAAGRMAPGRWGDRVLVEHSTAGNKPLRLDLSSLTDEQLEALSDLRDKIDAGD